MADDQKERQVCGRKMGYRQIRYIGAEWSDDGADRRRRRLCGMDEQQKSITGRSESCMARGHYCKAGQAKSWSRQGHGKADTKAGQGRFKKKAPVSDSSTDSESSAA